LSCIGWHLHKTFGPSLHYGAHDYYAQTGPFLWNAPQAAQYTVSLDQPWPFDSGQYALLVMTVNSHMDVDAGLAGILQACGQGDT
jgi:hypothetical protein